MKQITRWAFWTLLLCEMEEFSVLLASDPLGGEKKKKNRWKAVIPTERRKSWKTTVSKYINYTSRKWAWGKYNKSLPKSANQGVGTSHRTKAATGSLGGTCEGSGGWERQTAPLLKGCRKQTLSLTAVATISKTKGLKHIEEKSTRQHCSLSQTGSSQISF